MTGEQGRIVGGARSLTQSEAAARADLLTVERYDVAVDLTGLVHGPEVRAVSTVRFQCHAPGTPTFVDCTADVVSATLNGEPLPAVEAGRLPLPAPAADNVLVVESVQPRTDGEGAHRSVDPSDGEVYLWMSFEPDEARHVWACFDQPDLKAPHGFVVSAPETWTVVSNSPVREVVDGEEGARVWTFADTPPLSTYNPVVLAGPLHEVRREAGGHDLGLFVRRSMAEVLDLHADQLFQVTEQGLEFFGRVFRLPFPQHKYDQVFMPEFGGAMENYGCVAWSDAFLTRSRPTPAEQELLARVLLHEMAHMWFGNIVTMRWWDDLWLNEAFAEFAANWALTRATSFTDAWAAHLAGEKLAAYLADQGPGSHPIRQPIPDVASAAAAFDAITYPKGASTLAQLMTYLGEETFSRGMAAYFARHAWGNTTLDDLVGELARASGRDLAGWQRAWLETEGVDLLRLDTTGQEVVLEAVPPRGQDEPRPHVLAVSAYRRTGEGLERTATTLVEVTGRRTPVQLPADADLHLVNDDDLTFARMRPDEASRASLFELAGDLPTPLARGVAVATAWDMLVNGEARTAETVGALARVLRAETAAPCVEPYLTLAVTGAELWSPEAERPALEAEVAAACAALAEDPDRRRVALRGLARTAPDTAALDHVLGLADDEVDLHWRVLQRRAQLTGVVDHDELERLLARDPDPDAGLRAVAVRAALPTAEAKETTWRALVVDRTVPVASVGQVATAFWRPGQQEVLAPYASRYVDLVPELHRGGMIAAMVFSRRLFPVFGLDPTVAARAEEAAASAPPVVARPVLDRLDEVGRMVRARGA